MSRVNALVLTGFGLNCDRETSHALELAGAEVRRVHINALIEGQQRLDDFQILAFGGGFSWGDDHGAGVIQAVRMRTNIGDQIIHFVESGKLVIGICNGFQTLVNIGLLPALNGNYQQRSVALIYNDCGNFRDQWVHLKVNPRSPCVFTKGLGHLELPIRHGEGKLWCESSVTESLLQNNQIVMQYSRPGDELAGGEFPFNPNGSLHDMAGICDPSGRVFGLMPHPEAYHHWSNHPDWTRTKAFASRRSAWTPEIMPPGLALLKNGVDYMAG
jgi:phosphoribosylformylglycinamidine synthase